MSASFTLEGVNELRAALRALPSTFTRQELGPIVRGSAEGMAGELRATYHKRTGTLANRVTVEQARDANGLKAKVRNRAPHAHLYENGSVQRFTKKGANRGTMPAQPTFVPAAIRWRARMLQQARAALQRLKIPGFSGSAEVRES